MYIVEVWKKWWCFRIPFKPDVFSGFDFTTALVVYITEMISKTFTYVRSPEPVFWSFSLNSYWGSFDRISRLEDARMLATRDAFRTRMRVKCTAASFIRLYSIWRASFDCGRTNKVKETINLLLTWLVNYFSPLLLLTCEFLSIVSIFAPTCSKAK